jgi:hypothetical protein
MKVAIIATTIFVPRGLEAYVQNAQQHGHKDVIFIVTGDKKTPAETKTFCEDMGKKYGYEFTYLDVPAQYEYLRNYPELFEHVPWNCIQRRNISLLLAYEKGADVIITMDDDNFILEGDYIGLHTKFLVDASKNQLEVVSSADQWYNICDHLAEKQNFRFYHRGYPMEKRWLETPAASTSQKKDNAYVSVNAGLWLDDPDIDAITRIYQPICATKYTKPESFALATDTWSPFNSQNTAVKREVMPAYWMCPCVGRYDDIWPSYIIKRIAAHLNHHIVYGFPVVKQERNPHNYYVDFDNERMGMQLTLKFSGYLMKLNLSGTTYEETFADMIPKLREAVAQDTTLKPNEKTFLDGFVNSMDVWKKTIERCHKIIGAK